MSGAGRILVPVNFRLNADEVAYIVEHSGASVLLVDPELDGSLSGVSAKHRFVLGTETDGELFPERATPEAWEPDEDATATRSPGPTPRASRPAAWARASSPTRR